jgi:ring-1,2-phenylacetyl-CoA epoxidase subunit PaaE
MSVHFQSLTVEEVRRETPDCVSVSFRVPEESREAFHFLPGQHLTLRAKVDGEELRRNYSICSSPLDGELRIAVKEVAGGRFSTYVNRVLKAGDVLDAMPPMGRFCPPVGEGRAKRYMAFAAGSGITPIASIVKTVLRTEPESTFVLVYGNRSRSRIVFREELEALKNMYMGRFQVIHVLSRERTEAALHSGRIDADKCRAIDRAIMPFERVDEFFLCGPSGMIEAVSEQLAAMGVSRERIHVERFHVHGTAAVLRREGSTTTVVSGKSAVTLLLDGVESRFDLDFDGSSILDAAMSNGLDVPFACKGGMCCTCRAKLEKGEVDMDLNYALTPEEVAEGYILTCQSHPRTAEVQVNYDAR